MTSFVYGGLNYETISDSTVKVVEYDEGAPYSGAITIPSTVSYGGNTYTVIQIDPMAFSSCENLTSVIIPNSVTTLGYSVFANSANLTAVTLPNDITEIPYGLFLGCTVLASVNIPSNITSIGTNAFGSCYALPTVTLPNTVTSIGENAFLACRGFTTEMVLPENLTRIDKRAFMGCLYLPSIVIGSNVTSIGSSAFYSCNRLVNVTIKADTPPTIQSDTFHSEVVFYVKYHLMSLYNSRQYYKDHIIRPYDYDVVTGTDGLTYEYNKLTKVLTVSGEGDMQSLYSGNVSGTAQTSLSASDMTSLTVSAGITSIRVGACQACIALTVASIANTVEHIYDNAFLNCSALTTINIPRSVISIGDSTFKGCIALTNASFKEGLMTIGEEAFMGDTSLGPELSFPTTLETIGESAFEGCTSLTTISISSTTYVDIDGFISTGLSTVRISGPIVYHSNLFGSNVTAYVQHLYETEYRPYYSDVRGAYFIRYMFRDGSIYDDTSDTKEYTLKYDSSGQFHTTHLWQYYQASYYADASVSGGAKVTLNKIANIYYAVEAPERSQGVSRVAITAGHLPTLDFGEIQSITDTYTSNVTSMPILPKGYSGTFAMDTGVQRQIVVRYKRVQPMGAVNIAGVEHTLPWDASSDCRHWSNKKWKQTLDRYTDRWQMNTNGCRLHILAPTGNDDEDLYTFTDHLVTNDNTQSYVDDDIGINVYISSAPTEYSNESMQIIDESITFKVGTIYPHPSAAEQIEIALYERTGISDTPLGKTVKYPANAISVLPNIVIPDGNNYKYVLNWVKMDGSPLGKIREPFYPKDVTYENGYAMAATFLSLSGGTLVATAGSTTITMAEADRGKLYYFYYCGGGGAGGIGRQLAGGTSKVYAGGGGGGAGEMKFGMYTIPNDGTITIEMTIGNGGQISEGDGSATTFTIKQDGELEYSGTATGGKGGHAGTTNTGSVWGGDAWMIYGYGGSGGNAGGSNGGDGGNGGGAKANYLQPSGECTPGQTGGESTSSGSLPGFGGNAYTSNKYYYAGGGGGGAPQLPPCSSDYIGRGTGFYGGNGGYVYRDEGDTLVHVGPQDGKHGGGGGGGMGYDATFGKGGTGYVYYVRVN